MTGRRFYIHELIGRLVHDQAGQHVGRIFDVRAEERDGEMQIVEYYLGTAAALQRVGLSLLRVVGVHRLEPKTVPWDKLDLTDPARPVLID
ncbi:MAG TPA: hypothetical protein VJ867_09505 [Gemmatimonadaceae bacterium]|nr:hypothetical protein [Gemmatimonadaceae bacterium]